MAKERKQKLPRPSKESLTGDNLRRLMSKPFAGEGIDLALNQLMEGEYIFLPPEEDEPKQ